METKETTLVTCLHGIMEYARNGKKSIEGILYYNPRGILRGWAWSRDIYSIAMAMLSAGEYETIYAFKCTPSGKIEKHLIK